MKTNITIALLFIYNVVLAYRYIGQNEEISTYKSQISMLQSQLQKQQQDLAFQQQEAPLGKHISLKTKQAGNSCYQLKQVDLISIKQDNKCLEKIKDEKISFSS